MFKAFHCRRRPLLLIPVIVAIFFLFPFGRGGHSRSILGLLLLVLPPSAALAAYLIATAAALFSIGLHNTSERDAALLKWQNGCDPSGLPALCAKQTADLSDLRREAGYCLDLRAVRAVAFCELGQWSDAASALTVLDSYLPPQPCGAAVAAHLARCALAVHRKDPRKAQAALEQAETLLSQGVTPPGWLAAPYLTALYRQALALDLNCGSPPGPAVLERNLSEAFGCRERVLAHWALAREALRWGRDAQIHLDYVARHGGKLWFRPQTQPVG